MNAMSESSPLIEIDGGKEIWAVTFAANGEYIVGGGEGYGVGVWQVQDGKQMATLAAKYVSCLAVSKDGRWIAAGTAYGYVIVWDAKTFEKAFSHWDGEDSINYGVDFSPDSTRLVATSTNGTATIWDVANRKKVQTLDHEGWVIAAKYSAQGDRIATATHGSVRVWDSNNGRLLVDIPVKVRPERNTGLLWSNSHLFVVSDSAIKQLEPSSGSTVSEWPAPDTNKESCIALPKHAEVIAYATKDTVTFWDTSTRTQLDFIQDTQPAVAQPIRSIALSPDDQFLATSRQGGKITVRSLSPTTVSIVGASQQLSCCARLSERGPVPVSPLHPTFQEPDIQIDEAALESWKHDQLENANVLLTATIAESQNPTHHVLASRALVRARLQLWDAALVDAEQAIEIRPSVISYIAKSLAHVGNGDRNSGYRACDIAFERFHSSHVSFLLLVKAIIVFMAGEHRDAISRVDDLIATIPLNSICHVVQAYMYLLLGNSHIERSDYEGAIRSFERGQAQMRHDEGRSLLMISLISGWKFDNLDLTVRQGLCEALHAAGRTKDAVECFHQMTTELGAMYGEGSEWALDFKQRCFQAPTHRCFECEGRHPRAYSEVT